MTSPLQSLGTLAIDKREDFYKLLEMLKAQGQRGFYIEGKDEIEVIEIQWLSRVFKPTEGKLKGKGITRHG